jgi:hypothetical protein
MKSTTKKPRVGFEQAERLREIAKTLDRLRDARGARDLRTIANLIAPESSVLRQQCATYVYRLFQMLPRGVKKGLKIKVEVGRLYDYAPSSVPVTAWRNKKYGASQIKRLKSGDDTVSPERIIEEVLAIVPEGKLDRRTINRYTKLLIKLRRKAH